MTLNGTTLGVTLNGNGGPISLNGGSGGIKMNAESGGITLSSGNLPITLNSYTQGQITVSGATGLFSGMTYTDDFSSSYTKRSLVDKGYVDSVVSGNLVTVVNSLTSTAITSALSANQGRILNDKFTNYVPLSGGTLTGALTVPSLLPTVSAGTIIGASNNTFNTIWVNRVRNQSIMPINGTTNIRFTNNADTTQGTLFQTTGNWNLGTGSTDNGYKLNVEGNLNATNITRVLSCSTTTTTVNGATDGLTEKLLVTIYIPANTISNGILSLDSFWAVTTGGISNAKNIYLKTNTTNSLSTATMIGQYQVTAGFRNVSFQRKNLMINGVTMFMYPVNSVTSVQSDQAVGSSVANGTITFNPTVDNYLFLSGQVAVTGNDLSNVGYQLTFTKTI